MSTAVRELLDRCLRGESPSPALVREVAQSGDPALFTVLAEGLSDRFEKRLADAYARIFAEAVAPELPGWTPARLVERYERVRRVRRFEGPDPRRVVVLSRVTLGADVAVTSVLLDAVKRRFPAAEILFAGGEKNCELFAADPGVTPLPLAYARAGTMRDRVAAVLAIRGECSRPGTIVVDPDSRLTQLGLLPLNSEEAYFFFESRVYGGDGDDALPVLAARWAREVFEIPDARAYIAVRETAGEAGIAVSLGVGGNAAKRVPDPFERELLGLLAASGESVLIDSGGGGEEAARAARASAGLGVRIWQGSFAAFAGSIARSRLYVGYDSAGQHVAAACGVPLVTVFAGFPSPRMFQRWMPFGPGPRAVVQVQPGQPAEEVLAIVRENLRALR